MAEKCAFGTNYVTSYQFPQIYFPGLSHHVLILKKTRFGGVKTVFIGRPKKDNLVESFVDIADISC